MVKKLQIEITACCCVGSDFWDIFCLLQGRQYYVQVSAYNMKGWGPAQLSQPPSAVPSSKFCKASTVPKYCIKESFIQKHTTVSNIIDWEVLEPLTTGSAVRFVLLIQISCLLKGEKILLIETNILGCRAALLFNYHDLYSPCRLSYFLDLALSFSFQINAAKKN